MGGGAGPRGLKDKTYVFDNGMGPGMGRGAGGGGGGKPYAGGGRGGRGRRGGGVSSFASGEKYKVNFEDFVIDAARNS